MITTKIDAISWPIIVVLLYTGIVVGQEKSSSVPPSWQNPNIGLTLDAIAGLDDADSSWESPGLTIRGAELIISANIDPYAFLLGNILVSEHGAELHEAFALFPCLPFNFSGRLGMMLANFGHWNRYHIHAMPFTSEPRIYKEYAGGMLALTGFELSWMVPVDHYIEVTLSAYNRFLGHTHDIDPAIETDANSSKTADKIAEEIGAEKHGSHWHGPNGEILYEEDLLDLAGKAETDAPEIITDDRRLPGFAYGGNVRTGFEFGDNFSLDLGASAIYQHEYKMSRRLKNYTYSKLLYDVDMILYWHPLTSNKYRNLQLGAEMLGSYEGFEFLNDNIIFEEYFNRLGVYNWLAWRQSERWQFGGFAEIFQTNDRDADLKKRFGAFITLDITHYQYVRVEYSRWEYPGVLDGVNLIRLQYDATIGYHTHGRQR
jgi:hypothetical protein